MVALALTVIPVTVCVIAELTVIGLPDVTTAVSPLVGMRAQLHFVVSVQLPPPPCELHAPAASYGLTTGPPPGAPIGVTGSVLVSANAFATLSRPLPTCGLNPTWSAFRARRPSTIAFVALGSLAKSSAA